MLVLTDHKPLCKLFGDRSLDEIENPRLLRLKEKTMRWQFRIAHVPGEENAVADATSRNPVSNIQEDDTDMDEEEDEEISYINVVIRREIEKLKVQAVTWERIKIETERDNDMNYLRSVSYTHLTLPTKA